MLNNLNLYYKSVYLNLFDVLSEVKKIQEFIFN